MPRLPIHYSKTIIYRIVCKNPEIKDCYVGQTTDFTKRKCKHKSNCTNINDRCYNVYVYQFIRENGGWINFDMVEIEKYNATDQLDANKRERYWIEQLQATLNKVIPTRTDKEYYENNKYKIKENYSKNKEHKQKYNKEYNELNKDKIQENKSEQISCICGKICSKGHLKRHEQSNKHIEFLKTI